MGLADWFSNFCSNIQVQDGGTKSTRYKAITRRLNTGLLGNYFWHIAFMPVPTGGTPQSMDGGFEEVRIQILKLGRSHSSGGKA
jgi:hypothetical protein